MKISSKTKPRLVLYVTTEELRACKVMARKNGLRTPQQWALSVLIKALVIQ
jgi:hypothetical protein